MKYTLFELAASVASPHATVMLRATSPVTSSAVAAKRRLPSMVALTFGA